MSSSIQSVNKQIAELVDAYANGSMAAAEYRHQRRTLICEVLGQPVPEVETSDSGDETSPGMQAVQGVEAPDSESVEVQADMQANNNVASGKTLYILITVVTLLVALTGAGGLFWYIFRE